MMLTKIEWASALFCFLAACSSADAKLGTAQSAQATGDGGADGGGDGGASCTTPQGAAESYCFACGTTATCDGRSQICEHTSGGAPPGVDLYQCVAIPKSCASDPSCACVAPALGLVASECSASGGNLTAENPVP
ncbi:MAG TPA: hypothetical protein VGI39_16235 [Polyangiaceae bacterium]|jgi:hypothetical protein